MKMEYRTPFPNVAPLFVFTLCIAACCTATTVESAEPTSSVHTFRWRQPEGKVQVLWIGGGHWHDTLETAAILRRALERTGQFHVTYTEDTRSLRSLDKYDVICLAGMLDSLAPTEEQALLDTVRQGTPFLAFHAASACFREPPPATTPIVGVSRRVRSRCCGSAEVTGTILLRRPRSCGEPWREQANST